MKSSTILVSLVLVFGTGCSNNTVTRITGSVFVDGAPANANFVKFWPKHDLYLGSFSGIVVEDGSFVIEVDPEYCPAKPGSFVVLVQTPMMPMMPERCAVPGMMEEMMKKMAGIPKVAMRFGDPAHSPLETVIEPGENELGSFQVSGK